MESSNFGYTRWQHDTRKNHTSRHKSAVAQISATLAMTGSVYEDRAGSLRDLDHNWAQLPRKNRVRSNSRRTGWFAWAGTTAGLAAGK
jgi:hypothetical protein